MNKSLLIRRIREHCAPMKPVASGVEKRLTSLIDIRCVAFDFYGTMFLSGTGNPGPEGESDVYAERALHALAGAGIKAGEKGEGSREKRKSADSAGSTPPESYPAGTGRRTIELIESGLEEFREKRRREGVVHPEPDIARIWKKVLEVLYEEGRIRTVPVADTARLFTLEFEFQVNEVWPAPELESVLAELRRDRELGIISNSQFYSPLTFEALTGKSPVEMGFAPSLILWSYQEGIKKPSLDFYRLFTRKLSEKNYEPGQVLYVGNDIRKDIAPARKLGMKTALYTGDLRSVRHEKGEADEEPYRADLVITDLTQLLSCLD